MNMDDEKLYNEVDDSDDHGPKEGEVDPKAVDKDGDLYKESSDGDHGVDPKSVETGDPVDTSMDGEE